MNKLRKINALCVLVLLLGDIFSVGSALSISYWLRFHSNLFSIHLGIPPILPYIKAFIVACTVLIFIFQRLNLYNNEQLPISIINEFAIIFKGICVGFFVLMSLTFFYREISYSRQYIFIAWALSIINVTLIRYIMRKVEIYLSNYYNIHRRVAIIGTGKTCEKLIHNITINVRWKYKLIGIIDLERTSSEAKSNNYLGTISELSSILKKHNLHEIILTVSALPHQLIEQIIIECEKNLVSFKLVPDMFELLTSQVDVVNFGGVSLLGLKEPPLHRIHLRFVKRTMDIIGSIVALAVFSPVMLIVAGLIKLKSKGPLIYKQLRCGEDGRTFLVYKFRTMQPDAETITGPIWAKENDPRRTKIGKFLRESNLDELPQLFNVFSGQMSLVGPRPERPHFVNKFKTDIPRYMSRHLIKSGITGWAQVNGLRGNTSITERIKYDLYYIENWSLFLDIKILIMTFFTRKNAY